jgi:coproporphyrinogen III oxidase-like Fe-S oxidoreductase
MQLMCEGRLAFDEVEARLDAPFATYFERELAELEQRHRDLATVDRERRTITATPLGHHLIRNLGLVFDRYARGGVSGSPTI